MSHKTLVNGTVYEVGGGKTLIDGVAYSIDKGKTLVGGTAYEVGFAPPVATVTITGTGLIRVMGKICAVTVDGVDYTSATQLVVPVGTVVSCTVSTQSTYQLNKGWVKINGVTVLTASGLNETYNYTVSGNVTINMSTERNSDKDANGYIEITEL